MKPVLLYSYISDSSFVIQDIESLRISYNVKLFRFRSQNKPLVPFSFIRQKIFLLWNIFSADLLMCQFAGYHSLLPVIFGKLFKKPCLVVVGGTDCTSMPSINYGNLRKPLLRWFTLKSLKYSTHIISPSSSLIRCDYTYADDDYPGQGFLYFDNSIKTPCTVIFNGVDTSHFKPAENIIRRKNSFLTICASIDRRNYFLKGIDLFLAVAEHFPDFEFTIIGKIAPDLKLLKPGNVSMIGYIPGDQLPLKMSEYSFYCQLSMSEGFGLALAEAMSCGCVPIVSQVGILDFIAGDSGYVLSKRDINMLTDIVKKAAGSDIEKAALKTRARIVDTFDSHKRRSELLQLITRIK